MPERDGVGVTTQTFDGPQMNRAILFELVLAVLVTQMDVFHRLLDTTSINAQQFVWALVPAIVLLFLWESGSSWPEDRFGHRLWTLRSASPDITLHNNLEALQVPGGTRR